jgi:hypothetical protein
LLALKETPVEFEVEARLLLAVKLYEMGRVSTGRAAELAGMGRVGFLLGGSNPRGRVECLTRTRKDRAVTWRRNV